MGRAFSAQCIEAFFERVHDTFGEEFPLSSVSETAELGQHWRALGMRPGDVVILALPNGRRLLAHFFGVLAAGAVPALVAPNPPSARLGELVRTLGARAVAAVRLPNGLTSAGAATEASKCVVQPREGETAGEAKPAQEAYAAAFDRRVRREEIGGVQLAVFPTANDPAANPGEVVLLTSGTTGFATGCVFPVESLLLNATRHADAVGQRADDTVLVNLPLCFSYALVAQALRSADNST